MPGPAKTVTDLPAYMRAYNANRREKAKRAGICIECNCSPARPARTKCADCAHAQSLKRAVR